MLGANRKIPGHSMTWSEWVREYTRRRVALPRQASDIEQIRAEQRLVRTMLAEYQLRPWAQHEAACDNEGEVSDGPDA